MYAQDPTRVIDDLIRRRSVFRADDVNGGRGAVAPGGPPETFLRMGCSAKQCHIAIWWCWPRTVVTGWAVRATSCAKFFFERRLCGRDDVRGAPKGDPGWAVALQGRRCAASWRRLIWGHGWRLARRRNMPRRWRCSGDADV